MNPNWVLSTSGWRQLSRAESQMPAKLLVTAFERKQIIGEKVSPERQLGNFRSGSIILTRVV
jgi:hypothetical protein